MQRRHARHDAAGQRPLATSRAGLRWTERGYHVLHAIQSQGDPMQDFFSQLIHIAQIQWVQQAFWTVVLALATLATSRIVARAMRHILDRDSNPLPSSSIIINIVRATILILGASIILDVIYNINANAIITTLGVGGIAISLGFQDTLSNLIGGLQVTFMGIVRPGDNIEVGSETGVVQDVS